MDFSIEGETFSPVFVHRPILIGCKSKTAGFVCCDECDYDREECPMWSEEVD